MSDTNYLYPAFFRLDRLKLLVVGAGAVGEEKLRFILKSSPNAHVRIVAPWMGNDLRDLLENLGGAAGEGEEQALSPAGSPAAEEAEKPSSAESPAAVGNGARLTTKTYHPPQAGTIEYHPRPFHPEDVLFGDLIIAATDISEGNLSVYAAAKAQRRLCNIADTPSLCDFYLGSIVTRGPLKVAISTNGKSPTFAKRFRQWLEAELPEFETTNLLDNLKLFRDRLTGNFATKVRELNTVTTGLLASPEAGKRCPPGGCALAAAGEKKQDK